MSAAFSVGIGVITVSKQGLLWVTHKKYQGLFKGYSMHAKALGVSNMRNSSKYGVTVNRWIRFSSKHFVLMIIST